MIPSEYAITKYIENNAPVSLAALSDTFGLKQRTIRSYIHRANASLAGIADIGWNRQQGGYALSVADARAFDIWCHERRRMSAGSSETAEDRIDYLLDDLLYRTEWITIDDLSNTLHVSRVSISSDLKAVERTLGRFQLTLDRKPHYGIRISGSEQNRRLCLASMVINKLGGDGLDGWIRSHGEEEIVSVVTRCVDETLRSQQFHITSFMHQNLITHICVAILRISSNQYVPMDAGQFGRIRDTRAYEVASALAMLLETRLGCALPQEEIAYLAIHLAGKQLFPISREDEANLVITDEVWRVVDDMLELVWQAFRFDFRSDLELRMNLAKHIVPLSTRLNNQLMAKNPLLQDIKSHFPLAYCMAIDASSVISEHYESVLSEDEVGYIALSFALSLERMRTEIPKKRILVVCASGMGSARLLEQRYRREFGPYLNSVRACDASQLGEIDFSEIDYVFTTIPLDAGIPVPVCEVNYFLSAGDVARIRGALDGKLDLALDFDSLRPELFFPNLDVDSKRAAIEFLCKKMREHVVLPPEFEQLVWEREQIGPTAFGNLVALPHPARAVSACTMVAVGLLRRPIDWDGQEVRAVFLIVFAIDDRDGLEAFFERMAFFFMDSAAIRKLLDSQSFETLMALVRSTEKEG